MSNLTDHEVIEAMLRYGGGFVRQLGYLFRQADGANRERLKAAFPQFWQHYRDAAEKKLAAQGALNAARELDQTGTSREPEGRH